MQHVEGRGESRDFQGNKLFFHSAKSPTSAFQHKKSHTTNMGQLPLGLTSYKGLALSLFGLRVAISKNQPNK